MVVVVVVAVVGWLLLALLKLSVATQSLFLPPKLASVDVSDADDDFRNLTLRPGEPKIE